MHSHNYTYNAFGQRTGKSYSYMQTPSSTSAIEMGMLIRSNREFCYDYSGRLIFESNASEYYGEGTGYKEIVYLYDESGIVGMMYTANSVTTHYYFQRNLLGDVIGIYNTAGTKVAGYVYDSWGNCTITSDTTNYDVAHANSIRYRGYFYDDDTKLYYLNARYYNPEWRRFVSPDSTEYIDSESVNGLNLYAYCNNDPINYADPSGCFPVLSCILGLTALVGIGLTIGGVAAGNNTLTAVGLTIVAIPALTSGGMAIAAGIGGATLTGIVGGVTTVAGIGSGLFASAEYQEAFTGNNWMLDAGMSESWYNGLVLTTAAIATFGTFASSFCYSFKIKSIDKIGKLVPSNHPNEGYFGVRFNDARGSLRSIELQKHAPHGLHFQLNSWNPKWMSVKTIRWWTWYLG